MHSTLIRLNIIDSRASMINYGVLFVHNEGVSFANRCGLKLSLEYFRVFCSKGNN